MKLFLIILSFLFLVTTYKSISKGTVSNGSLINGVKIPKEGDNYFYFDDLSYRFNRAYLNDRVLATILDSYTMIKTSYPNRKFMIMEGSNKGGGKIAPHATHQNGTSIDLGSPLINEKGEIYDALDKIGAKHYLLEFNNEGKWVKNTNIQIDFECMAQHILMLQNAGEKHGTRIKKVILKTDLKAAFFATPSGKKDKDAGIYFVQSLPQKVNDAHDDHYHIDFEILE